MRDEQSFITSSGDKVKFIDGLYEFFQKARKSDYSHLETYYKDLSVNIAGGADKLEYDYIRDKYNKKNKPITRLRLLGYAQRVARAYSFIRMLSDTRKTFPFSKSLDIGCGYAIQPRIMKGLGLVNEAVGIDLYDRCTSIDEKYLKKQQRRIHLYKYLEWMQNLTDKFSRISTSDLKRVLLERFPSPRTSYKNGWGEMLDEGFYNLKFVRDPHLDRFISGNVYELEEKFDLITSFSSLEYFDSESLFKKISDSLQEDGVFYVCVNNWWHPGFHLGEHFPYAPQRLAKDEYLQYLHKYQPESVNIAESWYNYFDPSHPTISDYIQTGNENGLIPLSIKSHIRPSPFALDKRGVNSLGYLEFHNESIEEVLSDIQRFRPDIRISDIIPFAFSIIFKKIDKSRKLDRKNFKKIYKELDFHYQPDNPIMKLLRQFVIKILKR